MSAAHSSDLELVLKHWMETSGVLFGEFNGVDRRDEPSDENEENEPLARCIIDSFLSVSLIQIFTEFQTERDMWCVGFRVG